MIFTAQANAAEASTPAPQSPAASEADARLTKLFNDSDEASLQRNPINALYRGDLRYADRLGDYISDAYFDAERTAAESDLAALKAIDRSQLNAVNQIAYDVFKWQSENTLKGLRPDLLALTVVRPIDHFYGFQVSYPDLASGEGAAPFKTLLDYENNLKRNAQYVTYLDAAIARFREGMKSGVVQPKLIVRNVIEQLNLQIAQGVEGSTFYGPIRKFPEGISAADQARCLSDRAEHDPAAFRRRGAQARPERSCPHQGRDGKGQGPDRLQGHAAPVLRLCPRRQAVPICV
jgi:uncharacterized protein (DUF885 family)